MAAKLTSAIHRKEDPRFHPAYTVAEAAHYLRMPEVTLRSWVSGRLYPVSGQPRKSPPVIHLDDPKGHYLSFINLVEAHVLVAIRRRHGVKLPKVRRALDYVRREFHVERPLIEEAFETDGLDLFIERYGQMINASREGQQAMKEILTVYLQRIERDARGLPIKLYPFTRDTESDVALKSDPRLVVMSPTVSFGRPVIVGTGIPVTAIYERYKAGDSVAELAQDFRLETRAVEEAIRCEAA
ncbi:MAG: DUF433 domain-containing protein [Bryobacteraceae bacterium]|nr:DUF433 domain-containing protein [Bryobacteraceae bacterium]MDW8380203.1 DUF433 domain-containing protein [Bryobacterales bacterium]